jgi:hypothetical protein
VAPPSLKGERAQAGTASRIELNRRVALERGGIPNIRSCPPSREDATTPSVPALGVVFTATMRLVFLTSELLHGRVRVIHSLVLLPLRIEKDSAPKPFTLFPELPQFGIHSANAVYIPTLNV